MNFSSFINISIIVNMANVIKNAEPSLLMIIVVKRQEKQISVIVHSSHRPQIISYHNRLVLDIIVSLKYII